MQLTTGALAEREPTPQGNIKTCFIANLFHLLFPPKNGRFKFAKLIFASKVNTINSFCIQNPQLNRISYTEKTSLWQAGSGYDIKTN
jgi:hypothetical protein